MNIIAATPTLKPIIFSPPMVLKILDGQKTQTRRLLKENIIVAPEAPNEFVSLCKFGRHLCGWRTPPQNALQKGSHLWVRETWCEGSSHSHSCWGYRADMRYQCGRSIPNDGSKKWKPSIFMPFAINRLALEITEVKVERLLEITNADANNEGFADVKGFLNYFYLINPKLLDPNPYVWAIAFEPVQRGSKS